MRALCLGGRIGAITIWVACRVMLPHCAARLLLDDPVSFLHEHVAVTLACSGGPRPERVSDAIIVKCVSAYTRGIMQRRRDTEPFALAFKGGDGLFPASEPAHNADFGTGNLVNRQSG
jgi:hypothetical protein